MAAPLNYQVVFDQTTNNFRQLTAKINAELNKVEYYNLNIKVCHVEEKQVTQIANNFTDALDYISTDALNNVGRSTNLSFKVEDIVSERYRLSEERKVILESVDQELRGLTEQRDVVNGLTNDLARQLVPGINPLYELYEAGLIAVTRWKEDLDSLQNRRDLVGQNI